MVTLELKSRINKLDYDLKQIFENVYIHEKSVGNQFFFKVDVNGEFWNLNESNAYQRAEVKIIIHKNDLMKDPVSWSYSSNPVNELAHYVTRVSRLEDLAKDVEDVVVSLRMDESYFSELAYIVEPINESSPKESIDSNVEMLKKKIEAFGVLVDDVDQDDKVILESNKFLTTKPDTKICFYHHSDLKLSDKFLMETTLNAIDGVNYTIFKEGVIEINYTPIQ
jgi:hypothetical protein